MTDTAADQLARVLERSPGTCILFAYADVTGALHVAEDAGEHRAVFHLRRAADALEAAHKALSTTDGTAILADGDPEPADTWPSRPSA